MSFLLYGDPSDHIYKALDTLQGIGFEIAIYEALRNCCFINSVCQMTHLLFFTFRLYILGNVASADHRHENM